MPTVTRKDIERQVMALQSLAMECAKARTVKVVTMYDGENDWVTLQLNGEFQKVIPLREWGGVPVALSDALNNLQAARCKVTAMHMQALDTLSSENTEVGA
jgi:hypothetical protein